MSVLLMLLSPFAPFSANVAKINEFGAKGAPKVILEAGRFQDRSQNVVGTEMWHPFCITWPMWGAILDPTGRQGAPKSELVGTKAFQNSPKTYPE